MRWPAFNSERPLAYKAKHPYGAVGLSHCKYWSQLDLKPAKEAEARAVLHEDMAKAGGAEVTR